MVTELALGLCCRFDPNLYPILYTRIRSDDIVLYQFAIFGCDCLIFHSLGHKYMKTEKVIRKKDQPPQQKCIKSQQVLRKLQRVIFLVKYFRNGIFIGYLHEKRKQCSFQKSASVETKDVFVECMSLFRHHRPAKPRKYLGNH